jgi:hypothetical protein
LHSYLVETSVCSGVLALCRLTLACAGLLLLPADLVGAQDIKAPIRGLVSMGAYRFVGYGGDPVNTLEPLDAKPGIFGGLVVIASWKQLQPTPESEIGPNNVIDRALAEVRAYNERNPQKPLAVKLRGGAASRRRIGRRRWAVRRSRRSSMRSRAASVVSGVRPIGRPGPSCSNSWPRASTGGR